MFHAIGINTQNLFKVTLKQIYLTIFLMKYTQKKFHYKRYLQYVFIFILLVLILVLLLQKIYFSVENSQIIYNNRSHSEPLQQPTRKLNHNLSNNQPRMVKTWSINDCQSPYFYPTSYSRPTRDSQICFPTNHRICHTSSCPLSTFPIPKTSNQTISEDLSLSFSYSPPCL